MYVINEERTNPFDILGISRDSDQDSIKKRYREWMIYLHPDKNKEYIEDRGRILQIIQDSYQKCILLYQERDLPSENIDYKIEEQLLFDANLVKKKKGGMTTKINKNFHNKFEKIKEKLDQEDPEKIGYNEFSSKVDRPVEFIEYENTLEDFFHYPEEIRGKESVALINPGEFGISKISNFTLTKMETSSITNSKFSLLEACDLHEAFSNTILNDEADLFVPNDTETNYNNVIIEREEHIEPKIYEDTPLLKVIKEAREHIDIQHKRDAKRRDIYINLLANG